MAESRLPPGMEGARQAKTIEQLVEVVEACPHLGAVVITGSFARGDVDPLSDVDLLLIAYEGAFLDAWGARQSLRVSGSLVAWDNYTPGQPVGTHKWVTSDLVLVECLISPPSGGARLAEPFATLAGDVSLVERFPRRSPIDRSEMSSDGLDPVEIAYDRLKEEIRRRT